MFNLYKEHISAKARRLYVSFRTVTLLGAHAYPISCSSGATKIRQQLTLPQSLCEGLISTMRPAIFFAEEVTVWPTALNSPPPLLC